MTAQRVEEGAQKVPIATNAFNAMEIEDRQIVGIGDLALFERLGALQLRSHLTRRTKTVSAIAQAARLQVY